MGGAKNRDGKDRKDKDLGFTKEEEILLQDFSRNVSTKSSALFYGNAFIVSIIPLWLYWRIHMVDVYSTLLWFILGTAGSTYLVAFAYKNTKFILKHKIAIKREEAVAREVNRKLADDKKMSKKEKDERALWKKNEVADYEATTFSIFYNNALFLTIMMFFSFYLLRSFTPTALLCQFEGKWKPFASTVSILVCSLYKFVRFLQFLLPEVF